jgi:hypothetical protein
MKNVGHDGGGDGCPIEHGGYDGEEQMQFRRIKAGMPPMDEDGCYDRVTLPSETCGNSDRKDWHDAKLNRFW